MKRKHREPSGDRNGSRTRPDRLPRGATHPARLHPERQPRGAAHAQARLTDDQVRAIRTRYVPRKVTMQMLADEHGVDRATIGYIIRGDTWRHLL